MLRPEHLEGRSGSRRRWWASGAAVVAAVGVVGVAHWAGNDLEVAARGQVMAVPWGAVVLATVLGAVAAQALRLVARRTARPRRTYWLLAGVGLVVSSAPPLDAATDTATSAWLLLAHAVVAAVLLPAFSDVAGGGSPRAESAGEGAARREHHV